ncbi:LANO_0D06392g1_1 [Lachancea nothofagi CBS 11611]|uniref:LANO_0D06392g1_1 n=1 Tax=Lachancea nothofagi CBS 11611 TaxID=1266666 RepID=A0A1G4JHH5_9SACH|nr:LANO_0D06392g1_1 [Lachancea nothofagi CBS 11611]
MFHSRRSRESKVIDSEALAAASAIGRALDKKGTRVDVEKLPRYNSISRSNSMARAMSMSGRANSLRSKRDSLRSSSLQMKKPQARDSIDESEFFDAEDTFQQFGGPQAQNKQVTVKKYVPGPSGLRLVEVPISEVQKPPSRRSSLNRRSTSMNSGLNVRNNSLNRKSSMGSQPSLTKRGEQGNGGAPKKHEFMASRSDNQKMNKPLAQQPVKEETDEQLQKDIVHPIIIPSSPKKTISIPPSLPEIVTLEPNSESQVKIDTSTSKALDAIPNVRVNDPAFPLPPKVLISPPIEHGPILGHAEINSEPVFKKEPSGEKSLPKKTVEDVINDDPESSANPETQGPKLTTADEAGNSMAKYMRSANQYLNKAQEKLKEETAEIKTSGDLDNASNDKNADNIETPSLVRTHSPMKSALKKTVSKNAAKSKFSDDRNSTAHDAYISLATAENTRLNAQLSNEQSKRQPPVQKVRPSSMINGDSRFQKEGPTTNKPKHRSMQAPLRGEVQPPVRSSRRPDSVRKTKTTKPQGTVKTSQPRNDKSMFYPPEPPQKRSSFEKVRPDQSHMGFKKLSLRDSMAEEIDDQGLSGNNPQPETFVSRKGQAPLAQNSHQTPLSTGGNWSSRFQDSDSEDEVPSYSAPQPHASKPTGKSGPFSFKGKKENTFQPPQPKFAQSSTAPNSNHNTPNKKISTLSLRSASTMSNNSPAKTGNNLNNRFFSEQLPAAGPEHEEATKKKKSFGKKLKKLFGRK